MVCVLTSSSHFRGLETELISVDAPVHPANALQEILAGSPMLTLRGRAGRLGSLVAAFYSLIQDISIFTGFLLLPALGKLF